MSQDQGPVFPGGIPEVSTADVDRYLAAARAVEDAVQQALDASRGQGVPRPALFVLHSGSRHGPLLEAGLEQRGTKVGPASPDVRLFMLALDDAREVLRPVFGAQARRLFRVAQWPVSYWTVEVTAADTRVFEGRTRKDAAAQPTG
jgi:hypothetical protein